MAQPHLRRAAMLEMKLTHFPSGENRGSPRSNARPSVPRLRQILFWSLAAGLTCHHGSDAAEQDSS